MAFVATVTFKNGIGITGTGLTVDDDTVFLTGTTPNNLITLFGTGGLPNGVVNLTSAGVASDTACRCPVGMIEKITVA